MAWGEALSPIITCTTPRGYQLMYERKSVGLVFIHTLHHEFVTYTFVFSSFMVISYGGNDAWYPNLLNHSSEGIARVFGGFPSPIYARTVCIPC